MRTLETLTIKNFKSIREQTLALGSLNVFIGGNGAGKSNLIQVFRFLREIVNQRLARYTQVKGGADDLLYFGRKRSPEMSITLNFAEGRKAKSFSIQLESTDDDTFAIVKEEVLFDNPENDFPAREALVSTHLTESYLKEANRSSVLKDAAFSGILTEGVHSAREVWQYLDSYRVYHFHDTSDEAGVKKTANVEDNRELRPQAENLAAFLYWLQQKKPDHFANIEDTVRQIAPYFDEFRLEPSKLNESKIRLEWKEKGSDAYFNASSLSDGTLRFICLATLLLQPDLPSMVLLDEPELGLHPAAVTLLADLLSSASTRTQVIVATQSVTLVNHFLPESVWTVDREDNQSVFKRLAEADMSAWLDDYALGELWEKNVFGARP